MIKAIATLTIAALLASCTSGPPRTPRAMIDRMLAGSNIATPGKIVAAELAFARMAREKGQWTAFREFATDDAVMFVPEAVNARDWLRRQDDPEESVQWQPHQVWMSCDGSLAVTKGAWQRPDGSFGYFTTIWQQQDDGDYKWVLDQGNTVEQPLAEPDIIESVVADCETPDGFFGQESGYPLATGGGSSADQTLSYIYRVERDLSRTLAVSIVKDGETQTVLDLFVAAPKASPQ